MPEVLVFQPGADFCRLSVRFAHDNVQKAMIFKYLIERRAEIEQDLREEYEKAVRQTGD